MSLINCSECGTQVSDKATLCPKCACPINATTIELTSKSLKGQMVLAILLCCVAVILLFVSPPFGIIAGLIGFSWYIISRVKIWWNHK